MTAHLSGSLSSCRDAPFEQIVHSDLETLRNAAAFLLERKTDKGCTTALLSEKGASFCFNLAHLLALHLQKICLIDCNFDRIVAPDDTPGLWHYLNDPSMEIPFRQLKTHAFLPAGGVTRGGVELLASPQFSNLLATSRGKYDFIFLLRQAPLASHDATQLQQLCDLCIVGLGEEPQTVIHPYLKWSEQKESGRVTFVRYPPC